MRMRRMFLATWARVPRYILPREGLLGTNGRRLGTALEDLRRRAGCSARPFESPPLFLARGKRTLSGVCKQRQEACQNPNDSPEGSAGEHLEHDDSHAVLVIQWVAT